MPWLFLHKPPIPSLRCLWPPHGLDRMQSSLRSVLAQASTSLNSPRLAQCQTLCAYVFVPCALVYEISYQCSSSRRGCCTSDSFLPAPPQCFPQASPHCRQGNQVGGCKMPERRATKHLPGLGIGKEKWRGAYSEALFDWLATRVNGRRDWRILPAPGLSVCGMGLQEE